MIRGLYTSANGLSVQQQRMNAIANNVANINTNGFKKDIVTTSTFLEHLVQRDDRNNENEKRANILGAMPLGSFVNDIVFVMEQGLLQETQNPTDISISGEGFFSVQDLDGNVYYTRDGAFKLDQEGFLVTVKGDNVLGENGPLQPGKDFKVGTDGKVFSSEGKLVDSLVIMQFDNNDNPTKSRDNYYTASDAQPVMVETPDLRQGFLEKSNVDITKEMTDLIEVFRLYQANQRLFRTQDEILQKAVTQVGVVK
jgi:flagellar basal-body rod protein FlgF